MKTLLHKKISPKQWYLIGGGILGICLVASTLTAVAFTIDTSSQTDTIGPGVLIYDIDVSNATMARARELVTARTIAYAQSPIVVPIDERVFTLKPADTGIMFDITGALEAAYLARPKGDAFSNFQTQITAFMTPVTIPLAITINDTQLAASISHLANDSQDPIKDLRITVEKGKATLHTDTTSGKKIDEGAAIPIIRTALLEMKTETPRLSRVATQPTVSRLEADKTLHIVEQMLARPLELDANKKIQVIDPTLFGSWITTSPNKERLTIAIDTNKAGEYLARFEKEFARAPLEAKMQVEGTTVKNFTPPQNGTALSKEKTATSILQALISRTEKTPTFPRATIAVDSVKPVPTDPVVAQFGIIEKIGTATTNFIGSPSNRRVNIKAGATHLHGILIKPGEEFSTIKNLGSIDAKGGYLQELVIKGTRTLPEYGGGLCQVSTTLFRSVMNAGLPITQRQNHSYRVPYYEKDGDGKSIGPGLDATVYFPAPDFRFVNDTPRYILVQSSVDGNRITFNLYGTGDGRISVVDGPKTLSTTPAGNPIYAESPTLKPGETKQLEKAHGGGSAVATYTIKYPNGTEKKQVFKSIYKNWPAQFLVGAQKPIPIDQKFASPTLTDATPIPVLVP